jgi:hypothetical protein
MSRSARDDRVVRLLPLPVLLTIVVAVAACGGPDGRAAARAACAAYGSTATTVATANGLAATAEKDAALAVSSDVTWTPLQRDIATASARAAANAAAQRAGHPVPAADLASYFAADEKVRADCASAGNDLGPLKP